MSITEHPHLKPHRTRTAAGHHQSSGEYGGGIAIASGALGAAIALVGAAQGSLPVVVAAAILLACWGFLTAANHGQKWE